MKAAGSHLWCNFQQLRYLSKLIKTGHLQMLMTGNIPPRASRTVCCSLLASHPDKHQAASPGAISPGMGSTVPPPAPCQCYPPSPSGSSTHDGTGEHPCPTCSRGDRSTPWGPRPVPPAHSSWAQPARRLAPAPGLRCLAGY